MAKKQERRKYWRESDARAFVEEYWASGLTITAFAQARGIPAQRLHRWRRRLETQSVREARRGRTKGAGAAPGVVRIARVERMPERDALASPSTARLSIELGGASLAVPAGFDAATLRVVIEALSAVGAR